MHLQKVERTSKQTQNIECYLQYFRPLKCEYAAFETTAASLLQ